MRNTAIAYFAGMLALACGGHSAELDPEPGDAGPPPVPELDAAPAADAAPDARECTTETRFECETDHRDDPEGWRHPVDGRDDICTEWCWDVVITHCTSGVSPFQHSENHAPTLVYCDTGELVSSAEASAAASN